MGRYRRRKRNSVLGMRNAKCVVQKKRKCRYETGGGWLCLIAATSRALDVLSNGGRAGHALACMQEPDPRSGSRRPGKATWLGVLRQQNSPP